MAAASSAPQFASLYVGDLHVDVTEAMLHELFNAVAPVSSIRVCRDTVTHRSLGYGYVNFHSVSDAGRAMDTLNHSSIRGRACRIMWSQRDPSLRKSGAGNIYVKNLDRSIDNKALFDTFSLFGNILSCKVAADRDGLSHGHGFIHYETEEAAKQAIERVHGMQIGDKTVQVSTFVKQSDRDSPAMTSFTNVYVKGIPTDWNEAMLNEVFGAYGEITSSCLSSDPKGRQFAFVNFADSKSATKCVAELHDKDFRSDEQKRKEENGADGQELFEEKLYVQRAQTKNERQREFRQRTAANNVGRPESEGLNLYVKNLDDASDEDSLRILFEPFGTITSVKTMKDDKGICKGFGFVAFQSPEDATKAVTEMHLKVVKGKPLYVGLAEKRNARAERLRSAVPADFKGGKGGKNGKDSFGKGQALMQMDGLPVQMPMQMPQVPGIIGYNPMLKGGLMVGGLQMGIPGMRGTSGHMMSGAQMAMMQQQQQMMHMMQHQGAVPMGALPVPQQPPQTPVGAVNASVLANAAPAVQKQMIGEKLHQAIAKTNPEMAGKVTGMMLEMDNSELLMLLETPEMMRRKVDEALQVLSK